MRVESVLSPRGARRAMAGVLLAAAFLGAPPGMRAPAHAADSGMVRLPGHVLPALAKAAKASPGVMPKSGDGANGLLNLTFTLKRDDEAGFQAYLRDVYDPRSPDFHRFLSQAQLSGRFGPSENDYRQVWNYLQTQGFQLAEGSVNRMTLTMRGTRAQAEQAFGIRIDDYRIGNRAFYANDGDPALPPAIAARIQAIAGLSDLAVPQPSLQAIRRALCTSVAALNVYFGNVKLSAHQFGGAADIFIDVNPMDGEMDDLNGDGRSDGEDSELLFKLVDRMSLNEFFLPYIGGIGKYSKNESHGAFVHVDVRGFRAIW